MLGYRFLRRKYGLEALRDQRLKISEIMELNDPFEFLCVDVSDEDNRRKIKKNKLSVSKQWGLLCFSKNWRSPVQWAHYAKKHKGLCLGFDVKDERLTEVCYVKRRLDFPENKELDQKFKDKLTATKYSDWDYEEEFRLFVSKNTEIDGSYYCDFSSKLQLKEIIIGEKSKITHDDIYKALGKHNKSNIKIINARSAFRSFKMVMQKDKKLQKRSTLLP